MADRLSHHVGRRLARELLAPVERQARALAADAAQAGLKRAGEWVWRGLEERIFATAVVPSDDDAFHWLLTWLAQQPAVRRGRRAQVRTTHRLSGPMTIEEIYELGEESEIRMVDEQVRFDPGHGTHRLRYQHAPMWVTRAADEKYAHRERLEIRMIARDAALLRTLIAEAQRAARAAEASTVGVSVAINGAWQRLPRQPGRQPESVILPAGVYEAVTADVRQFLADRAWYAGLGVPFRRGYLFHGGPGGGKSSCILALAAEHDLHLHILNLAMPGLDDAILMDLLATVREGAAIVLEDADAVWSARKGAEASQVTFSGLINALDGVAATEGRLLFMTTNHLAHLDPALIRPGRVDYRLEFGPATPEQAERLFQRFFPDSDLAPVFAAAVPAGTAMAALQECLIAHRGNPTAALAALAGATQGLVPT